VRLLHNQYRAAAPVLPRFSRISLCFFDPRANLVHNRVAKPLIRAHFPVAPRLDSASFQTSPQTQDIRKDAGPRVVCAQGAEQADEAP
jgi:hypothetical protein